MIKRLTATAISVLALSANAQTTQELQTSDLGLNVEAFGGMRWGKLDLDNVQGQAKGTEKFFRAQEFKVGANYQIPNVPVAAGFNLGFVNYNNKDTAFDSKQAYAFDTTIEAKAWLPTNLLPTQDLLIPYVRVAYTPFSMYRQEVTVATAQRAEAVQKIHGDNNGYNVGAGANIKLVDNLSAAVEYSYSQRTLKTEDQTTKAKADQKLASHGVLLGVTAHM